MTVNIGSSSYTTSQTYDSAGRIDTQTYPSSDSYPSGLQIENTYNGLGMLERVQSPGGGTVYYQMLDSDHYGKMTSRWLGDGTTTTQSYADHSARITEQHTQLGSTNIQRLTYAWDSVGNMSSRSDLINALTETFSYDGLDRLTQAQVGVATPKDYGYNIIGNMTSKTDVGNYAYLATQIHAVNQITNGGTTNDYTYSGNGNLETGDDLPTLTWSSYNKPTQITKGGITYDFSYGTDKKRYKKVHNDGTTTATTHYLGDSFEHKVTGSVNEYRHVIRAGGTTIAVITDKDDGSGSSTKYLHRDHLGSVTAITDTAGSIIERLNYGPWGQRRSATDWQTILTTATDHRGYTGHEHLDDIGIIHMNGRVYSPKLGKMLSPDPVTQAPEDGQNYNRYSYVMNNPLKYTDPSGYRARGEGNGHGWHQNGATTWDVHNPRFWVFDWIVIGGKRASPDSDIKRVRFRSRRRLIQLYGGCTPAGVCVSIPNRNNDSHVSPDGEGSPVKVVDDGKIRLEIEVLMKSTEVTDRQKAVELAIDYYKIDVSDAKGGIEYNDESKHYGFYNDHLDQVFIGTATFENGKASELGAVIWHELGHAAEFEARGELSFVNHAIIYNEELQLESYFGEYSDVFKEDTWRTLDSNLSNARHDEPHLFETFSEGTFGPGGRGYTGRFIE